MNYNALSVAAYTVLFLMSCYLHPSGWVSAQMIERRAETNTLSSVGTATSIVSGKVVADLQIKSVHGVGSTTVTNRGNYLEIYSTDTAGSGESNTISSVGTATSIVSGKVGVDLQTKSLAGTGGTTITNRGNYLEVNSTSVPTFATQADVEGGTEDTKSVNSLRAYQAITYHSFLKSNIDVSPVDGYPDKANGLLGTTMSPSDTLTWNMPADEDFKVNMSGTGKMIIASGTNTVNLSGARYLDYVWSGSSTANSETHLNTEVDIFFGTLTASSNVNCIWEIEVVTDQTSNAAFSPSYRVYLDSGGSAILNNATGGSVGGMWFQGWVCNFGSTTTQLYKSLNGLVNAGATTMSSRIGTLFDSKKDTALRLTTQTGTTTSGYYCGVRCVRIWKTQP